MEQHPGSAATQAPSYARAVTRVHFTCCASCPITWRFRAGWLVYGDTTYRGGALALRVHVGGGRLGTSAHATSEIY